MRILHTEASTGWGGQEMRILREAVGMRELGHSVMIAADPEGSLLLRSEKEGLRTIPVRFTRRRFLSIVLFFKGLIEREGIDVVNTHSSKDSWLVLPAARIAGNRPLAVRTRHLSTPVGTNLLSRFLYNSLPHFVITTGEAIREQMIRVNRFDPEKIVSIPTGVDTETFDPGAGHDDLREELGLPPHTPLVGAVSVIRSWKGLDYLVRAMPLILREVPGARCVIAGEGPYRKALERTIEASAAADMVYLLGHREDTAALFHSFDVVVHPSYANEGVPQTLLQAMAMKKPVVATDLAPLKEVVIDGETGILVPSRDPGGIARAVIRLLGDRELAAQLGERGRKLVASSYSYPQMLQRVSTLYAEAREGV